MDRYRSPQTSSSLQISSPRSLRPREERRVENTIRYAPSTDLAQRPPVIPVQLSHGAPISPDNAILSPHHQEEYVGATEIASSDGESNTEAVSPRSEPKTFVGGFLATLRRIPQSMTKHYSRESLHAEYLAEAEAASRVTSPRYQYASTVLSDIPENSIDMGLNRSPLPLPPPLPIFPPAGSSINFSEDGIGSPRYMPAGLLSASSKEGSADVPLPPEDTWAYYIRCIQLVLLYVYALPWSTERIVSDYIPARDGRAPRRKAKISWYAPRGVNPSSIEKVEVISPTPEQTFPELLVMPPTPTLGIAPSQFTVGSGELLPPNVFASGNGSVYSSGAATAVRPLQSPMSYTSAGYGITSPGASSHGQGRHAASYSWYYTSPPVYQPFPLGQFFQDGTSTPYTRTEQSVAFSPR